MRYYNSEDKCYLNLKGLICNGSCDYAVPMHTNFYCQIMYEAGGKNISSKEYIKYLGIKEEE